MDQSFKKLYEELKKSYPEYTNFVETYIDVTNIVNDMHKKLNSIQQQNTGQYRS